MSSPVAGHRVLIVAPTESTGLVRDTRRAIRDGAALLERASEGPVVLGVGEVLPFAPTRRRAASLPVDVARTIEETLANVPVDLVHVHEPFAPSASSVALRHSRALNVGSFHAPTERVLLHPARAAAFAAAVSGGWTRGSRSYRATRDLLQVYFPGDYEVILPGADAEAVERDGSAPVRLLACADEDRGGLRTFLRALRALPAELEWRATVWSHGPLTLPAALGGRLAERVEVIDATDVEEGRVVASADVAVLASEGIRPAPGVLVRALCSGTAAVASRLPVYDELLSDGDYGLQFEPGDVQTLTSHLTRLISEPDLRTQDGARSKEIRTRFAWSRVADELEDVYTRLASRRREPDGNTRLLRKLSSKHLIDVDLHMHTDHSYDCATPVEVLLAEARARGLGAIAITDHNEISGALDARAKADGIKVIVAEGGSRPRSRAR